MLTVESVQEKMCIATAATEQFKKPRFVDQFRSIGVLGIREVVEDIEVVDQIRLVMQTMTTPID